MSTTLVETTTTLHDGFEPRELDFFESFDLHGQRHLGDPHPPGSVAPLALRPAKGTTLESAIEEVKQLQQTNVFTNLLTSNGVLLFRGVPVSSPSDFSQFAHAFGYTPHEIVGLVVEREVAPNVAPANESAKEVLIYNHNESPQVPHAPEYMFFYGHKAPKSGGQTPISSSAEIFRRVQAELPDFVNQLASKGVLSRVTYKLTDSTLGGTTLVQAFGKDVLDGDDEPTRRTKIEQQIRRYNRGKHTTWEWTDDGGVVVTHRIPAIRHQAKTGIPVMFTGLAAYNRNHLPNGNARYAITTLYGDGTPIPTEYITRLADITDEVTVLHTWQEGDVLLFDNVLAQHGRRPWQGEQSDRVVYASLFDGEPPRAYNDEDWAQVPKLLDK